MSITKHYIRAKVRWDEIPDEIVITYEALVSNLQGTEEEVRAQKISIYNDTFARFGYTKEV